MIAYFAQICTISSIIQQIYHYTYGNNSSFPDMVATLHYSKLTRLARCRYYTDVMWAQLRYIKANYPSAEVIFKNGNFGFLLFLSNIRKLEFLQYLRLSKPRVGVRWGGGG